MIVLSLFDGMSAGRVALCRAGVKVKLYYRAEIDKYANMVAQANYPFDHNFGDVTKWREWNINWSSIDLLIGGSPCQGFSMAGKQLGFDDDRSNLFLVYVDILNHIRAVNPSIKFMLENVKMKKEYLTKISEYLGVEPILINSALVSAQNRQRYYWANWHINQPNDLGILLNDILEKEVDTKFNLNTDAINYMSRFRNGRPRWEYHKNPQFGKSACLTANIHKGVPYGVLKLVTHTIGAIRGRYECIDGTKKIIQKLEIRKDAKTNSLTTVQKDNVVVWQPIFTVGQKINGLGVHQHYNKNIKNTQCLEVKRNSEKIHCLDAVSKDTLSSTEQPKRYVDEHNRSDFNYRRLTPIECERLQTFPDNYSIAVSNSQRYKMLGNGWTVDVVVHIFKCLLS